ncbi:SDR family oxidoreductase [Nonomuraea diastatica]|uniref:SDR family oxidoreductase n=1 Tax=Nonomuraea diastatica TaxID=1848329 RepID=UPI001C703B76|nr:SDR family oxidoreductase [Nonomuraea diastatica]
MTVSSTGTAWPSPGGSIYAASKAAVEQLTRVASRELGRREITVNAVSPGPTDTDMLRTGAPPEAIAGVAHMTALGRVGTPADIAAVIALLLGPDAAWLTGLAFPPPCVLGRSGAVARISERMARNGARSWRVMP